MRTLVWFRSDLRLHDNTALHHAARQSTRGVVALFILSPAEWKAHDYAPARIDFWLKSLAELSAALASRNIPLVIATAATPGDVPALVLAAAKLHKCDALAFNKEYELNESNRDATTLALFAREGIPAHAHTDQSLLEPGTLRTGEGRWYTVFTPFKKAAYAHLLQRHGSAAMSPLLPAPKKQEPTGIASDPVPSVISGFELTPTSLDAEQRSWLSNLHGGLAPGESAAAKRLAWFAKDRLREYKAGRDTPSLDATSLLSPALAIGTISPRQCLAAALDVNRELFPKLNHSSTPGSSILDAGSEGVATWISELLWREFYIHILVGFPRVCTHSSFKPATERLRWKENQSHFAAWCEGRTGVPLVDAGMRQLRTIGWMHNRVRMVTAMFLAKNLFLDWRTGEKYFMNQLVDGFLASNNGGWQWSASTGTDAAPYFRIMNPASQSHTSDPTGEYIRRWVPELRGLSGKDIHEPWELSPLLRAKLDYPAEPIVDLKKSRAAAIEAFQSLA
jgi:deoxyribodipyrimidine photo-lyase